MCHVGVLRALEEEGIFPDIVCGSSMGAVIGGGYAAGLSVEQLTKLSFKVKNRLIRDFRFKRGQLGFFAGSRVEKLFKKQLGDLTIEESRLPFACTAVDIESGELKIFDKGVMRRAIRASMSIPIAFRPIEIDGRTYIDGGVLCRIPIATAREMGADIVIAVDALGHIETAEKPKSIVGMALRCYDIYDWEMSKCKLNDADVVLTPSFVRNPLNFKKVMPVVEAGYKCARERMWEIKKAIGLARRKSEGER